MNNCSQRYLDFQDGNLNTSCEPIENNNYFYTSTGYINLSKISFTRNSLNTSSPVIYVCKYDKNMNSLGRESLASGLSAGDYTYDLDPNYLYKIAYNHTRIDNLKFYQCNVGVGSMSNELAFGTLKFNDTVSVIIPFVIIIIGFALGYALLKKLIYKGSKGKTI